MPLTRLGDMNKVKEHVMGKDTLDDALLARLRANDTTLTALNLGGNEIDNAAILPVDQRLQHNQQLFTRLLRELLANTILATVDFPLEIAHLIIAFVNVDEIPGNAKLIAGVHSQAFSDTEQIINIDTESDARTDEQKEQATQQVTLRGQVGFFSVEPALEDGNAAQTAGNSVENMRQAAALCSVM